MTKSYLFDGEINKDSVNDLISFANEMVSYEGESVTAKVYLDSYGGEVPAMQVLAEALNDLNESVQTTLIAVNNIHSCAFETFFKFKGKKEVMTGTFAMIHLYGADINTRDLDHRLKRKSYQYYNNDSIVEINNALIDFLTNTGVPISKIDHLVKDGEAFLTYNDLVTLIEKQ